MPLNKNIIYLLLVAGIVIGLGSTLMLLRNTTDTAPDADTIAPDYSFPSPSPVLVEPQDGTDDVGGDNSCTEPAQVQNVLFKYPGDLDGNDESFSSTQASCDWEAVEGAVNYNVKVIEVDTNTEILNTTVSPEDGRIVYDITANKTYRCEIAAVNSCGAIGALGVAEGICSTELVPTEAPVSPSPTSAPEPTPTSYIEPTNTPVVTATPKPTLPPTGPGETIMIGVGLGTLLIILGGLLFVL